MNTAAPRDSRISHILALLLLWAVGTACAQSVGSTVSQSPLANYAALFDTLVGQNFEAGRSICDQLARDFPGHPAVEYGYASVIYAYLCEADDTTCAARLKEHVAHCLVEREA